MKILQRRMFTILLLALWASVSFVMAQNSESSVVGSRLVLPIIETLAEGTNITSTATGTNTGFIQFCANQATAVASSRAINAQEESNCAGNGVIYTEYLLANNILVFVTNPQDTFNACLTRSFISQIFEPSANGVVTDWNILANTNPGQTLLAYVPEANTLNAELLDGFIDGVGFRADAVSLSESDILTAVASTTGAIGVVSYQVAVNSTENIAVASVDFENSQNGCVTPLVDNAEAGFYAFTSVFYLYANIADTSLTSLLEKVASSESSLAIESLGFTPPSASAYAANANALSGEVLGRNITKVQETFNIPAELSGTVNIGGSASLFNFFSGAITGLTTAQPTLTVNLRFEGEVSGIRRFCNGELDAVVISAPLSADAVSACEANGITLYNVPLGSKGVVILGNAQDSYSLCLTTEEIRTLWGTSAEAPTNWSALGEAYPDQALTLFGIDGGSELSDLLLAQTGSPVLPVRVDTQLDADPLYRAAATANVSGSLTYMSRADYQNVLANNQQNVRLVAVKQGDGKCVTPTQGSLQSGIYPLTKIATVVINANKFGDVNVQSVLWTLFADSNFASLSAVNFIGVLPSAFTEIRASLLQEFSQAIPEVTEEVTPEATEAVQEVPAEVTPEATQEVPAEVTPEATQEVMPEATEEATPAS